MPVYTGGAKSQAEKHAKLLISGYLVSLNLISVFPRDLGRHTERESKTRDEPFAGLHGFAETRKDCGFLAEAVQCGEERGDRVLGGAGPADGGAGVRHGVEGAEVDDFAVGRVGPLLRRAEETNFPVAQHHDAVGGALGQPDVVRNHDGGFAKL